MKTKQKSMKARFKSNSKNKTYTTLGYGDMKPNKRKTNDKSPQLTGKLELSGELIQELINRNHGKNVIIPISGWIQQSKYNDDEYISIIASIGLED